MAAEAQAQSLVDPPTHQAQVLGQLPTLMPLRALVTPAHPILTPQAQQLEALGTAPALWAQAAGTMALGPLSQALALASVALLQVLCCSCLGMFMLGWVVILGWVVMLCIDVRLGLPA